MALPPFDDMIDTEDQYTDNLEQIKALEAYLASFEGDRMPGSAPIEMKNPTIRALYLDGIRSMLEQFQREVAAFEAVNLRDHFAASAAKELEIAK